MTFINKLRDTQIPSRIDNSVFGNASGSLIYSILSALKSLNLVDADGVPSELFVDFVKASDENRPAKMAAIMRSAYAPLFSASFDLTSATAGQFDELIRNEYEAKGSTVDKVATFFIAAAKFAEVEISPHLAARKPTASSASAGKSKRQRKANNSDNPPPPPPPPPQISDKALEYKLIDLMKEADIGDEERSAIWTLVQYLTKKKATDE
ncbi:MAG: DUF5343 domain-containing protein [Rhodobacteraceae bacterium]|nr:DUF5343 domain-containing protein [Paracoccaceae bacterium]